MSASRGRGRSAREPGAGSEPVTVTVARVVRPDRREAYEREVAAVLPVATASPGNLGATLLRPGPGSSEYHLVYRFRDDASLAAWEGSPQRRAFLDRVCELVEDERSIRVEGVERYVAPPSKPVPRWRITVLTIVSVFAITSAFQWVVTPHVGTWPVEFRLLLSATLVVLLLGHVAMPALTRLFSRWLRSPGSRRP